ncbi:MAG: hypothetical protein OEQ25_07710 [Gammaproteobacteria bacterium]|nr:hypothetical protein [Gammaproteobacteria bacterium]MDH3507011.1 hypothetical protein [Gammaproteobacteria bacterium]
MVALLRAVGAALLMAGSASSVLHAQAPAGESPQSWLVQSNASYVMVDSNETGWLNGGLGKLRHDETDPSLSFDRLLIEYRGVLTPTLLAHVVMDYTHDGSSGFDLQESYLEWRPVPRSPNRHRFKLGAFYPRLSLENVASGWETPFSISSSAINTWIAEELKLLGIEWALQRRLGGPGSPHELELFAASYYGNDPTGTLLAWKGWGVHDRQTRWNEQLPLPPTPQLEAGTRLREKQGPWAEPFLELDHAPGYLAGLEWRYARRASVQIARYDNHTDPTVSANGQYGWETYFDQLALQVSLPWNLGFMAQWMTGNTQMGNFIPIFGSRVVNNDFESHYVLLTRMQNGHRFTLRYDDFSVENLDGLPMDDNDESGDALTLAYVYDYASNLRLAVEWLRVDSDRPAREYFGLPSNSTETVVRVQLRWQLLNHAD